MFFGLLIIFGVRLSLIFTGFPSWFLKCSFNFCSLSSWLSGIDFFLEVFLFPHTLHTACQSNRNCISATTFLILLIFYHCVLAVLFVSYLFSQDFLKFLHISTYWVSVNSKKFKYYSSKTQFSTMTTVGWETFVRYHVLKSMYIYIYIYIYVAPSISFPTFLYRHLKLP